MKSIFLFISLFIFNITSLACTCAIKNTVEGFIHYDVVLKVKVIAETEYHGNSKIPKKITVDILEVYKGNPSKTIEIELGDCQTTIAKLNTEWVL